MINAARLFGKGISFPPRVGPDGRIAWSEGDANVRESMQIILTTDQNERLMQPDFGAGLGLFLFEPNTVTTRHLIQDRIIKALAQWEPRILVESVDVVPDPNDLQQAIATITYHLVATQTRERVSLNVTFTNTQ
jgi:phage baseplate assembly protein W